MVTALAVDLGSSSGRVLAGTLTGGRVTVTEIHRFAHEAKEVDGELVWDLDGLWGAVVEGLRLALQRVDNPVSVSVDTWGVDFVALDAQGRRLGAARAYRDDRTVRTLDAFRARVSDEDFFALSGIAPATINSANQLVALGIEQPELAASVDKVLFLPDYFTWKLSGVMGWSRSIASTSGLCQPGAREWSDEMFARLGVPRSWVGELTDELTVAGPCIVEGLEGLAVVRAGAHDTACAVHALPISGGVEAYFLSCGSWSVLGAMLDEPLTSPDAFRLGLTNEIRTDGGVRPLFNITGLWILQECQRQWAGDGLETDIVELVAQARDAESLGWLIDPDDPRFAVPGGMVQRVTDALAEQGAPAPSSQGQLVRVVLESFAARYARGIDELAAISGRRPHQLNLVGGGSRNALLCQLTADAAGLPVVAGPAEASTLGAMLAQFETLGYVRPEDRASVIAASTETSSHTPAR